MNDLNGRGGMREWAWAMSFVKKFDVLLAGGWVPLLERVWLGFILYSNRFKVKL